MRKKCHMQHSSKKSKVCTKEHKQSEPVSGNKNHDSSKNKKNVCDYMKEYMQERQ